MQNYRRNNRHQKVAQ